MQKITPDTLNNIKKLKGHSALLFNENKVYEKLQVFGFLRVDLENTKQGRESVVMSIGKNLIIKFSNDHYHYGYDPVKERDYEFLQPLDIIQEKNPKIAIFPRLKTGEVSQKQLQELFYSLLLKGLFLFDISPKNLGLLNDGTAVIVDHGAVVPINYIDELWPPSTKGSTHKEVLLRKLNGKTIEEFMEGFNPDNIPDYEAAQNTHLSSEHLKYGQSTAFTVQDLSTLEKLTKGNLVRVIKQNHLYPHEIYDLLANAEASPETSWIDKLSDGVRDGQRASLAF